MTTVSELKQTDLGALEQLFVSAPMGPWPQGRQRGTALARVDSRRARSGLGRLLVAPFEQLRFGVDFSEHCWFFVHPAFKMGGFRTCAARSIWRNTDVLALHYDRGRLPNGIKRWLYDEVKPLSATLCLGLGGIQTPAKDGALFFFALEPA